MAKTIIDLSKFEYGRALEALKSAEVNFQYELYNASINRSYYAVFYAIEAVYALDNINFSSHAKLVSYFNKNYVHKKIIPHAPEDLAGKLGIINSMRNTSDYGDFFTPSEEDAKSQLETAQMFIPLIGKYLDTKHRDLENIK